jgi:dinuclear metal center YbgI/SA1388 family protein
MKTKQIIKVIEKYFPLENQEGWDNSGLQILFDEFQTVKKIFFCVNPSLKNIDDAIEQKANFVFTHHPFIFNGIKQISNENIQGQIIKKLLKNKITLYSAHTSADVADKFGVSSTMLKALGVKNFKTIDLETGIGKYGLLEKSETLGTIIKKLKNIIPASTETILTTDNLEKKIKTIAYCGGAGDSIMNLIPKTKADVYITADLRFHPVQTFKNNNPNITLINLNHSASEFLWLKEFAPILEKITKVKVIVSYNIDNVWINY